jgi:hypothetical protein
LPGDAEVGEFGDAAVSDQDVGRFHIAVHYAHGVGRCERSRDLPDDRPCGLDAEPTVFVDVVGERLAGHVLHHDIGHTVFDHQVEHANRVGM